MRDVAREHTALRYIVVVDALPQIIFRIAVAAILFVVLRPSGPLAVVPSESVNIARG